MSSLIDWCNANEGFINAIIALISLILSFIAIIISIHAARLPFKKGIKLSQSYDFRYTRDGASSEVKSHLIGISINAANVGFRNINLTFLGLAVRNEKKPWTFKKMVKLGSDDTYRGVIEPTEITTIQYDTMELLGNFDLLPNRKRIYILSIDSEGKMYHKYIGKMNIISNYINSNK